jgi:serine/threonine protein phosphatase 1
MTVTFIGDVHAWSDRLERVLAQAQGELVFMGDLVDRGPDPRGVLERVHGLCASGRARCLFGNHEYALLRSVGCDSIGLEADPDYFEAWRDGFGGDAVLSAYQVDEAEELRAALGGTVDWIASLPWVLEGGEAGLRWIAVHAGLADDQPLAQQLERLREGWSSADYPPEALFSKTRRYSLPPDLPDNCCVVSGHTPLPHCFVTRQRILCDTSGGLKDRVLSGVLWPSGDVISG